MARWSEEDIPDLTGKTVVVTGANSGLGYETSRALALRGAHVVLACRNLGKAKEAADAISALDPKADLELLELDLASLESIAAFAESFLDSHPRLDVLCNNAGVMAIPHRKTQDGFEMQIGTNHFGHFALTGRLLDRLLATPGSRIVNLSSTAHRAGKMRFDDLHWEQGYSRIAAYGQSKLANLLFTFELQRRLERKRAVTIALASHPGWAATELQFAGARMEGRAWLERAAEFANRLFSQSAAMGALPTLYAAVADEARGGDYIGPDGFGETWGHPKKVGSSGRSRDEESALRLWEESEDLTGVRYDALAV